ncbi:unknown [Bacteroides sp. CAG:545]|nr:unknown [Bacteroides sp. CAG:545]
MLINLLLIFLHHEPKFSVLKIAESCAAFHVKYAPSGARTMVDMNTPAAAVIAPSRASFVPVISTTQYSTKNRTAMMAETPSPPFRINAPRGAPMKKRMKQANASANFLSSSTSVRLRM